MERQRLAVAGVAVLIVVIAFHAQWGFAQDSRWRLAVTDDYGSNWYIDPLTVERPADGVVVFWMRKIFGPNDPQGLYHPTGDAIEHWYLDCKRRLYQRINNTEGWKAADHLRVHAIGFYSQILDPTKVKQIPPGGVWERLMGVMVSEGPSQPANEDIPQPPTTLTTTITQSDLAIADFNPIPLEDGKSWTVLYGAGGFLAHHVPASAADRLHKLNSDRVLIRHIAFTPAGGWCILYGGNGFSYQDIPAPTVDILKGLNVANTTIQDVSFTATGGWVVLFGQNGFQCQGVPAGLQTRLRNLNTSRETLRKVAFTADGIGWVVLYGSNQIAYNAIPDACLSKLRSLCDQGQQVNDVEFGEGGSFIILFGQNGCSGIGIPATMRSKLQDLRNTGAQITEAGLWTR